MDFPPCPRVSVSPRLNFAHTAFQTSHRIGQSMGALEARNRFRGVRAVIFDFDGTLAVLNIEFDAMRERVFELMKHYGVGEELIEEKYLLEIIDEVYQMLWKKNPRGAGGFYKEAHRILHDVEMRAAEKGRLLPGMEETLKNLGEKRIKVGIITRNCEEAVRKVFPNINEFCDCFYLEKLG